MSQDSSGMMKKESVILIAIGALVIGFLGGIVFSIYKSPIPQTVGVAPSAQQSGQQKAALSQQQASQIMALEQEVVTNPNNGTAWTQLGNTYFDTDNYAKAINAYEKSVALLPNNANVLTDLGVMYRKSGMPDKALENFDKAIVADPKHETARLNKGIVLISDLNDAENAMAAWEGLAKVNPNAKAPNGQTITQFLETMRQNLSQQ